MKHPAIVEMKTGDLIQRYAELCVERGEAIELALGAAVINRLGDRIFAISDELKARPGETWRLMAELFDHPNAAVRFHVATSLFRLLPIEARDVLQKIADTKAYPMAGHAGAYLSIADGSFST